MGEQQQAPKDQRDEVRCFIALEVPSAARAQLCREQHKFRDLTGTRIRFTRPENLHLTLKFLGEISPGAVTDVRARLQAIRFSPFTVSLGGLGVFPLRGRPRVLWVELAGEGVAQLHKSVEAALEGAFPAEHRFRSHITLGRIKDVGQRRAFQRLLEEPTPSPIEWMIDQFVLKSSVLTPNGPIYSDLEVYPSQST